MRHDIYSTHLLRHLRLTIVRNIHQRRREKLTLRKLAKLTGISEGLLDHYELRKNEIALDEMLKIPARAGDGADAGMNKEAAETLLFEREKLYEEIWAEPMMQVAKRYGISDGGLAKICKR
jgi:transcriptional regulator with XRE-family HTH domain